MFYILLSEKLSKMFVRISQEPWSFTLGCTYFCYGIWNATYMWGKSSIGTFFQINIDKIADKAFTKLLTNVELFILDFVPVK